jgi:iron-sulfur cluster repair protein YtfE (RIC family)
VFDCLRAALAVHETTEEMFVHPLARRVGGDTAAGIVDARLAEEREATKTLNELEKLGANGDQFATRLTMFQRAVHEHAEAEEHQLFPLIDSGCSQQDLADLADAILAGEQLAPTHAHPHAGQNPIALMVVGPFAAMVDKTRDHFTEWKRTRHQRN